MGAPLAPPGFRSTPLAPPYSAGPLAQVVAAGDSAGGKGPPVWAKAVPDRGPERLLGPVRPEGKNTNAANSGKPNNLLAKNKAQIKRDVKCKDVHLQETLFFILLLGEQTMSTFFETNKREKNKMKKSKKFAKPASTVQ